MIKPTHNGERYEIDNPFDLPRAAGFLWNRKMMIYVTCRGCAVAQFMQPEQPYYAHHPGRFFYIKDEESGALFSAPYEPVRAKLDRFTFSVGKSDIQWNIEKDGLEILLTLSWAGLS